MTPLSPSVNVVAKEVSEQNLPRARGTTVERVYKEEEGVATAMVFVEYLDFVLVPPSLSVIYDG